MPAYPNVIDERQTLDMVLAGQSMSRYGDGELKLALGHSAKSQDFHPELCEKLRVILKSRSKECLVCIPNVMSTTPKHVFWGQYAAPKYTNLYDPTWIYGSSFVSRPDSAPWIDTPPYWEKVRSLWRGLDVVLVRGGGKSLLPERMPGAASVEEVIAPVRHAYVEYNALVARLRPEKRRVILCLGATATVLAWELARAGVHAIDLGHMGMFLRRRDGEQV